MNFGLLTPWNVKPVWAKSFINIVLYKCKFGSNAKSEAHEAITECVLVTFCSVVFFCYIQDDSSADGTYNTQVQMYFVDTMDSDIAVNDQQVSGLYGDGKQDNCLDEENLEKLYDLSLWEWRVITNYVSQETAHKL